MIDCLAALTSINHSEIFAKQLYCVKNTETSFKSCKSSTLYHVTLFL